MQRVVAASHARQRCDQSGPMAGGWAASEELTVWQATAECAGAVAVAVAVEGAGAALSFFRCARAAL